MKRISLPLFVITLLVLLAGCAGDSAREALTEKEGSTLDRTLQRIVRGDTSTAERYRIGKNREGKYVYAVFVHVNDRQVADERAIPANSWSGSVATARLTVEELRRVARMEAVESIRLSGRAEAHEQ